MSKSNDSPDPSFSNVLSTVPETDTAYRQIYSVIRRIPPGRVATYGQVAELAQLPRRARLVGTALRQLPNGSRLPWQRVINARGEISVRGHSSTGLQRQLLEEEGVEFDHLGRIDLQRFRWRPRSK